MVGCFLRGVRQGEGRAVTATRVGPEEAVVQREIRRGTKVGDTHSGRHQKNS